MAHAITRHPFKKADAFIAYIATTRACATTALVILARKLARIAFSIVKHNVDFQPERVKVACAQP